MTGRSVVVLGPAYLDRVLRVDGPLLADGQGPPLDQSVDGSWEFADGDAILIRDEDGFALEVRPPIDWPGPRGTIRLRGPIRPGLSGRRSVRAVAWSDDLGGMGAGFAAAFGGVLHSALGPEDDPTSRTIAEQLSRHAIAHRPIRIPDRPADWTLLISSGPHGDKLPIGFRGCHAALEPDRLIGRIEGPPDLLVVAALPNRLAGAVLQDAAGARTRFFAPAIRNMADRSDPLPDFAGSIDILSCNRAEWEALDDREVVAASVPIIAVTDGPRGAEFRYTSPAGEPRRIHQPAFPRDRPPRDTNRAGEAFASALVATLLDRGWTGNPRGADDGLIGEAARRASAAAALVLDRTDFGFPSRDEIDAALAAGRIA